MKTKRYFSVYRSCLAFCWVFFFLLSALPAETKKLEVVIDNAKVYMEPNINSTVMATLKYGKTITLASSRRSRKFWNYVYFTSGQSTNIKTGYIHDSNVKRLFKFARTHILKGSIPSEIKRKNPFIPQARIYWGMLSEELRRVSGRPQNRARIDDGEIYEYQQKILGLDCYVGYVFDQDRLTKTRYNFRENYPVKNKHIEDFKKIRDLLAQKYGEPQRENQEWFNPKFKNDIMQWGTAVSLGHLKYNSKWMIRQTEILLSLLGEENKISLEIEYSGVKFQ